MMKTAEKVLLGLVIGMLFMFSSTIPSTTSITNTTIPAEKSNPLEEEDTLYIDYGGI